MPDFERPATISERDWSIFTERFTQGERVRSLAIAHGITSERIAQINVHVFHCLLRDALSCLDRQEAIARMTRFQAPLTKPMWIALYYKAPECFPGIKPPLQYGNAHYFGAGDYDATDFKAAFTISAE